MENGKRCYQTKAHLFGGENEYSRKENESVINTSFIIILWLSMCFVIPVKQWMIKLSTKLSWG
jgi:hypothetical protein